MSMKRPMAIIWALLLTACATPLAPHEVRVTFESEPPGAMIYSANQAYGLAPQTLTFSLSPDAVRQGWVDNNNIRALWPSGAEQRGIRLTLQIKEGNFKFSRPPSAPGLDKDLSWALQLRQTAAAEGQAASDFYKALQPARTTTTDCFRIGAFLNCTTR